MEARLGRGVGERLADPVAQLVRREAGRVDDEVRVAAQALHHQALLADALHDPVGGRQRMAAARGLVAVHEVVVGGLQEHDAVRDAEVLQLLERLGELAEEHARRARRRRWRHARGPARAATRARPSCPAAPAAGCPRRSSRGPRASGRPRSGPRPRDPVMIVKPGAGPRLLVRGHRHDLRHQAVSRSTTRSAGGRRSARRAPRADPSYTARASSGPNARRLGDLLRLRALQPRERPEPLQQRLLARRAHAGDLVERRGERALLALLTVIGDGEAVRLVAQVLQHEQRLGAARDRSAARDGRGSRPPRGAWRGRRAGSAARGRPAPSRPPRAARDRRPSRPAPAGTRTGAPGVGPPPAPSAGAVNRRRSISSMEAKSSCPATPLIWNRR